MIVPRRIRSLRAQLADQRGLMLIEVMLVIFLFVLGAGFILATFPASKERSRTSAAADRLSDTHRKFIHLHRPARNGDGFGSEPEIVDQLRLIDTDEKYATYTLTSRGNTGSAIVVDRTSPESLKDTQVVICAKVRDGKHLCLGVDNEGDLHTTDGQVSDRSWATSSTVKQAAEKIAAGYGDRTPPRT